MRRLLHILVLGLIGAGVAHIVILMLLPAVSTSDAWSRIAARAQPFAFTPPPVVPTGNVLQSPDPMFEVRVCRFDLAEGLLHVTAAGDVPYWSASVYERGGLNTLSVNDRLSVGGDVDIAVLTPAQMLELKKDMPAAFANTIFVEFDGEQGMVSLRVFQPDASWRPSVARFLENARCTLRG